MPACAQSIDRFLLGAQRDANADYNRDDQQQDYKPANEEHLGAFVPALLFEPCCWSRSGTAEIVLRAGGKVGAALHCIAYAGSCCYTSIRLQGDRYVSFGVKTA